MYAFILLCNSHRTVFQRVNSFLLYERICPGNETKWNCEMGKIKQYWTDFFKNYLMIYAYAHRTHKTFQLDPTFSWFTLSKESNNLKQWIRFNFNVWTNCESKTTTLTKVFVLSVKSQCFLIVMNQLNYERCFCISMKQESVNVTDEWNE